MRKQGQHKKEIGIKNKENVKKFFTENPGSTQSECSEALGLSSVTVIKHVAALRLENEK